MTVQKWRLFLFVGLSIAGCEPDVTGSIRAKVIGESQRGTYRLVDRQIDNVVSLRELRTTRFDFRAGSSLNQVIDGKKEWTKIQYDRGRPFHLAFHLEDGVVVADDDRSLEALSTLDRYEMAARYLMARGAPEVPALDVMFRPRIDSVIVGDQRGTFSDNAAYAGIFRSFLVLPPFLLQWIPLHLNLGVSAHEYGHSVVHQIVDSENAMPEEIIESNDFDSMNEGVSDLFGYAVTGDPNFILASVGNLPGIDRNIAEPKDYPAALAVEVSTQKRRFRPTRSRQLFGSSHL